MLYTIGYEGIDTQKFLSTLKRQGISVLVDVREMPLSRKKGFSKSALSTLLGEVGIEYIHIRALGAPKSVRHRMKETGNWDEYCLGYSQHLQCCTTELEQVELLARNQAVCLMCFEANYLECHRSLISNHLEGRGLGRTTHLCPTALASEVALSA